MVKIHKEYMPPPEEMRKAEGMLNDLTRPQSEERENEARLEHINRRAKVVLQRGGDPKRYTQI